MPYEPNTYSLVVGALDKPTGLCSPVLIFPASTQDLQRNVKHLKKLYPILSFPGPSKPLILSQSRVARSFPIQEWLTKG